MIERIQNQKLSLIRESVYLKKISDSEYFGETYAGFVSNSSMRFINPLQDGSPFEYKYGNHNSSTNSLSLGSIIHLDLLESIKSKITIGLIPGAKMKEMLIYAAERSIKDNVKFIDIIDEVANKFDYYHGNSKLLMKNAFKFNQYYSFLLKDEENSFFIDRETNNRLEKCDISMTLLKDYFKESDCSFNEHAIFASFKYNNTWNNNIIDTIINAKIKVDNFKIDHENKVVILNDLKTTISSISDFIDSSFVKYHYSRQFSFYLYILAQYVENVLGLKGYTYKANVVVISTTDGDYKIIPINQKQIEEGYTEWSDCLKRIAFHETYGYNLLYDRLSL